MSCELDKVISIINEAVGEVYNSQARKELNELKSDLTQFAVKMQSNNEVKDISRLLGAVTRLKKTEVIDTKPKKPDLEKVTNAELQAKVKEAQEETGSVSVGNKEDSYKFMKVRSKVVEDIKKDTMDLFMKAIENTQVKSENISTYYEGIKRVIQSILPVKVVVDDELAFVNLTVKSLLEGKELEYVAGVTESRKNTVRISSGEVSNGTIERFTEDWFLEDTEEGQRISELDTDVMYSELSESKELAVFKDKNRAEVASRLINLVKNFNGPHTLTHELIHIGSAAFMKENPEHLATKKVLALYEEALQNKEYIKEKTGQEYWVRSVDEFIAEALSNPILMRELNNTRTKYGSNRLSRLFNELVDTLLGMIGFTKNDNVYQHVLDGFTAMLEYQYESRSSSPKIEDNKLVVSTSMVSSGIAIKAQGC